MKNKNELNEQSHTVIDDKIIIKRANGTKRVQTINNLPTRTQKHHKDMTDATAIVRKYGYKNLPMPQQIYQDFSNLPSYQEALHTVINAEKSFQQLPSNVRTRFQNDPNELINFLNSREEHDIQESIRLGLRNKPTPPPAEDPQLTALKNIESHLKPKKSKSSDD